jgi:hypothetical protein
MNKPTFAMLCIASTWIWAASPQAGPAEKGKRDTGKMADHAQSGQNSPAPSPSIVPSIAASKNEAQATNPQSNDQKGGEGVQSVKPFTISTAPDNLLGVSTVKDAWDKTAIIGSLVLVLVGIFGIRYAIKTLKEMDGQRKAMEGQLAAMQGQLAEMKTAGEQTKTLIGHASQQATALSDAATAMQESAQAERVAAQASLRTMELYAKQYEMSKTGVEIAKLSADIAARVSIPTLIMDKFESGDTGAANLEAMLQYPKVKVVIKNYE